MNTRISKRISIFLAFVMILSSILIGIPDIVRAEGQTFVETFDNSDNNNTSYGAGNFVGVNNTEWSYTGGRGVLTDAGNDYSIDGNGLMFRRPADNPVIWATIKGGITDFSIDTKKAFTGLGKRELEVLINDVSKGKFVLDNSISGMQKFIVNGINIDGEFKLEIKFIGASSGGQTTIDNITWTSFGGGYPEPDTTSPIIEHTPVVEANLNLDLEIRSKVTDDRKVESVKLFYRTVGATEYKSKDINLSYNEYRGLISKGELNISGLEYYIEATDGTNIATSPENINTPYIVDIVDIKIPEPEPGENNFYFGQLHSHTNLSDGTGTPDDAYSWARDRGNADFFAVTDHSNWFDNDTGSENITKISDSTSTKWKTLNAKADQYNKDGEYAAIAGYEMTWSGSTGGWGHMNTFNTPWFASRTNKAMGLKEYYDKIAQWPDSINQLNHPGKTFGDFGDFGFYSEAADKVVQLIEVGNGEGPIRGSGYFPSYEYYTRALDKGWHLAPSNNQDNHKGNWVTSNDARNVVIADSLSRDSIYDGIRNLRSYATENKNLEIMYKINGEIMGSQLKNPEKLNFSININDPDVSDSTQKISKIDIISNGGVVAATKTFDSHNVDWNFELNPNYSYYYVKVTQANKDISVTAPIWTAEATPVGIGTLEPSSDYFELGSSIDINATIFNNDTTILANNKVEFYVGSISEENKIGEETILNVSQGSTGKASIKWTPDKLGVFNLYAVATLDEITKQFTASTNVEVISKGSAVKVMVDFAHKNHYVSGDYADKINSLKSMIKEKKMIMIENHNLVTDETLKDIDILIITSPHPKDKDAVTKSNLSNAEINAVKNFTDRGGSLIITSRANYGDGVGEYQNSIQGNKVLNAIESNIIFNSDQVIDNSTNGGQAYRLYFNKHTSQKYNLTPGFTVEDLYSFYSGCSVLLKSGGNDENVDFLVKGHSTTTNSNAGNVSSGHIPTSMGNISVIAAEKLPSGGKVIASGTTFFSDFEMSGDNRYTNVQIASNILDWMKPEVEIELKTIKEVRDGMPANFGQKFTIEGRVTAMSEAYSEEHNLNNAFFEVIYVQDETGGMTVFGISNTKLPLGTKVRVTGIAGEYEGDYQLQIKNESSDLIVLEDSVVEVAPKEISTGDSMKKLNEGLLVKVKGIVTRIDLVDNSLYVDDGSGEARVYVNGYISDGSGDDSKLGKWDPSIKVGDTVTAIGLAAKDPVGARLRVRNTGEIIKIEVVDSKYPLAIGEVEKVEHGDNVMVKVTVGNHTEDMVDVVVIIKATDKDGRAYKVKYQSQNIIKGQNLVEFNLNLSDYPNGIKEVKVYIWNSLDNMEPLSQVK